MVVCVPAATYDIASQDASEAFIFLGMNTNIERTGMDGTSRKCCRSEYRISTTMEDFFSNMNSKKTTHKTLYALQIPFPHVCYPSARNLQL
jgi:hypothetical protein